MAKRSGHESGTDRYRQDGLHSKTKPVLSVDDIANGKRTRPNLFSRFAQAAAHWTGKPATFLIAVTMILIWAITGPIFGFSDTWQLIVNTATTIVTFLMVFLIQNTQNRDTLALQVKLADLIIAMRGTDDRLAAAEDMSDKDLEALHEEYRRRAETTLETLHKRGTQREQR